MNLKVAQQKTLDEDNLRVWAVTKIDEGSWDLHGAGGEYICSNFTELSDDMWRVVFVIATMPVYMMKRH